MDPLRVLIIDDNEEYCAELERLFSTAACFSVQPSVHSGPEAIQAFSTLAPAVAVLDMIMPQMDGMEILRAIRERGLGQDAMIFATSPFYLDTAIVERAQELGVVYVFYKPMSAQGVFNRILDVINARIRLFTQPGIAAQKAEKERDIRCEESIVFFLRLLGVNPRLKGYGYLKACIQYCVDHYGKMPGLTTELYPYVAAQYDTLPRRVERDVRTAVEYAWSNGDLETQHKMFGYTVNSNKGMPTSKEFISMLCERVVVRLKKI